MTQLNTLALAAAKSPRAIDAIAERSVGKTREARSVTGRVVMKSNSMMRGFVRVA
ncbi:hypothetical protein FMO001_44460 [Moritella sp. F1]|nr:hypothetical protein FMO001_44460 [Moritella sp. F1]